MSTLVGFFICLAIYILLSILPFGFLSQNELAVIKDPSTAGILEKVLGKYGSWIMNAEFLLLFYLVGYLGH